jgi:hypothetical protein
MTASACSPPTTTPTETEDAEEESPMDVRITDVATGEVQLKEIDSKIWLYTHPDDPEARVVTYSIQRPDSPNASALLIESNEKDYAFRLDLPKVRFYPGLYTIKIYTDLDKLNPFKELEYNHIDPDFYSNSPSDGIAPVEQGTATGTK